MSENENLKTISDIVADIRERAENAMRNGDRLVHNEAVANMLTFVADRIEAAWKRERESDKRLLFRLLWFGVDDYQSDWACSTYRKIIRDCCERLGIPYHHSCKVIAGEMDKTQLGKDVAKEVSDEQ